MEKKYPLILLLFLFFGNMASSQEVSKERTTKYIVSLNTIKKQAQVDAVTVETKKIAHVTDCKLDWLNYSMEITVKEGASNGYFPIEKLKEILIKNNVALVKFSKEVIK